MIVNGKWMPEVVCENCWEPFCEADANDIVCLIECVCLECEYLLFRGVAQSG